MTETRFLCKTNKYGITTTFAVVVMLLLFMASCGKENKEVVEVTFDPENTYTLRTTDVSSLISDSGGWCLEKPRSLTAIFPRVFTWRNLIPCLM